jgi:2-polyprenyl-6-methoxyphenol hydroxylase-like FAD-dependent oxidoreductase
MAGLVTARVLADHFEQVSVVERDAIPDGPPAPRKGVPQGRQLHGLLKRGSDVLEELFPGLTASLQEAGAHLFDFGDECAWYHGGGWKKHHPSGMMCLSASRPLIEAEVRRRVFALPGVERRDDCEVTALLTADGAARVSGVRVKRRDGQEETIAADLTVDASGRGSRLPRWLVELGYPRPRETVVEVDVAYAGRVYRAPEGRPAPDRAPHPWKMLYVIGGRRVGAVLAIEGGQYIAVLAGIAGDHPPADPEGFDAFVRSLPTGELHRVLGELEPVTDVERYKFPANLRRHYDELARLPEGLVAVGDSVASFNPLYGQGMTAAAVSALALSASLRDQRLSRGPGRIEGLSRRYFRAVSRTVDVPWDMTNGEDFQFPEVKGRRPLVYPAMRWYLDRVHRAVTVDTEVYGVFLRVMHMMDGPEKLLAPRTALRVLRSARAADAAPPVHDGASAGSAPMPPDVARGPRQGPGPSQAPAARSSSTS